MAGSSVVLDARTEADLVRAVQSGCADAFSELFRRHYPAVTRACARRLGNRLDADEVAQAAFVRALERIDQCEGERRFGAWVRTIASRLCVDTLRARARTHPEEVPLSDDVASFGDDPEATVLVREKARHLGKALSTLPRRQREAVVARAIDERGPGEIASALGLSVSAVDSLLLRGRRRLALAYGRAAGERS